MAKVEFDLYKKLEDECSMTEQDRVFIIKFLKDESELEVEEVKNLIPEVEIDLRYNKKGQLVSAYILEEQMISIVKDHIKKTGELVPAYVSEELMFAIVKDHIKKTY